MAHSGETIENPVTGERITFRETADDTAGEAVRFDYFLRPGGFAVGTFDHVHPEQEERIEVRSGRLGVRIAGDEWTATPGTRFGIPPGTPHTVWNDGERELHAVVELAPALDIESFFETAYGLARDGETDRRGLPGPLQLAVLADEFRREIAAPGVPVAVQRALVSAVGALGEVAGYRARYPRYGAQFERVR